MSTSANGRQDHEDQGRHQNPEMSAYDSNMLPYDDPAIINPDELATFPKPVQPVNYHHHDHDSHLVNKRVTPARDGRNITRTDNHPDKHGYM